MKIKRLISSLLCAAMIITSQGVSVMASDIMIEASDEVVVNDDVIITDDVVTEDTVTEDVDVVDEDVVVSDVVDEDVIIDEVVTDSISVNDVVEDEVIIEDDDTVVEDEIVEVENYGALIPSNWFEVDGSGVLRLTGTSLPTSGIHVIPKECSKIPTGIFDSENKDSVKMVVFQAGNNHDVEIAEGAFAHSGIETFKAPDGMTKIGKNAFLDCGSLVDLDLRNVEEIGESAFSGCKKLGSRDISGGMKVKKIDAYAFMDTGFTRLDFAKMGRDAISIELEIGSFKNCLSLSAVSLPIKIEEIPESCFEGCERLTKINICEKKDGGAKVGKWAFKDCKSLTIIEKDNFNASEVGESAFKGCTNLTTVQLPESVKKIVSKAFEGCDKISMIEIYFKDDNGLAETGFEIQDLAFSQTIASKATIKGFDGKVEKYAVKYKFKKYISLAERYKITINSNWDHIGYYYYVSTDAKNWEALPGTKVRITLKPKKDWRGYNCMLRRDSLYDANGGVTDFSFISGNNNSQVFEFTMGYKEVCPDISPIYYTNEDIKSASSSAYSHYIVEYDDKGDRFDKKPDAYEVDRPGYKGQILMDVKAPADTYTTRAGETVKLGQWMFTYSVIDPNTGRAPVGDKIAITVSSTGVVTSVGTGTNNVVVKSLFNGLSWTIPIMVGNDDVVGKLAIVPYGTVRVSVPGETATRTIDGEEITDIPVAYIDQSDVTAAQKFNVELKASAADGGYNDYFVTSNWTVGNTAVATLSKSKTDDNKNIVNVKANIQGETYIKATSVHNGKTLSAYLILRIRDITPRVIEEAISVDVKKNTEATGGTKITIVPYGNRTIKDESFIIYRGASAAAARGVLYEGLILKKDEDGTYRFIINKSGVDASLATGKTKVYSGNNKLFIYGKYVKTAEESEDPEFFIPLDKVTITNMSMTLRAKLTGTINLQYNSDCYSPLNKNDATLVKDSTENVKACLAELAAKDDERSDDYTKRYIAATVGSITAVNNFVPTTAVVDWDNGGIMLWETNTYNKYLDAEKKKTDEAWAEFNAALTADKLAKNFDVIKDDKNEQNFTIKRSANELQYSDAAKTKPVTAGYIVMLGKGYDRPFFQNITISTKNVAPKYVMSASAVMENQNNKLGKFKFSVYNNATDKKPVLTKDSAEIVDWVANDFFTTATFGTTGDDTNRVILTATGQLATGAKTATVKIKKHNWTKPVAYTYKVTYENKAPLGKLAATTLKMNAASDTSVETTLELTQQNCTIGFADMNDAHAKFIYTGSTKQAYIDEANKLMITTEDIAGENHKKKIKVGLVTAGDYPKTGSYKFSFRPTYKYNTTGAQELKTASNMALTISVVNTPPAVSLSSATYTYNVNYPNVEEYRIVATYSNVPAGIKTEQISDRIDQSAKNIELYKANVKDTNNVADKVELGLTITPEYDEKTKKNYLKFKMNAPTVTTAYNLTYVVKGIKLGNATIKDFYVTLKGITPEPTVTVKASSTVINMVDYTTSVKYTPTFKNLYNPSVDAITIVKAGTSDAMNGLKVSRDKDAAGNPTNVAVVQADHTYLDSDANKFDPNMKASYSFNIRYFFTDMTDNEKVSSAAVTVKPTTTMATIKSDIARAVFRAGIKDSDRVVNGTITKTAQLKTHIKNVKIKSTNAFEVRNAFKVTYTDRDNSPVDPEERYGKLTTADKTLKAGEIKIECVAPELLVTGKVYNLVLETEYDGQNYKKNSDGFYVDKDDKSLGDHPDKNKMVKTGGTTITIPVVVYK